jgi:hypothetical protein
VPSKRQILETLSRQALLDLAASFQHAGLTGKSKDDVIDALVHASALRLEDVLSSLSRDQLKNTCREIGLSDEGREKKVLVARLLGKDGSDVGDRANRVKARGNRNQRPGLPVEDLRHKSKRKNIPPGR